MKQFTPLLLEVWREVCRHIEIGESVERVAPLLVRRLPVDLVLVRHLDVPRSLVETVGSGLGRPGQTSPPPRSVCRPEDMERLLVWCKQESILCAAAEVANEQLAGAAAGRRARRDPGRSAPYDGRAGRIADP